VIEDFQFSARKLLEIVNDILNFSEIGSGQMRLQTIRFNLFSEINSVRKLLSHRAQEKSL